MPEKDSQGSSASGVSRRTFVKAAAGSGAATSLAGCIYGDGGGGDGQSIVFGWDPNSAQEVGDEIVDLFYENGLDEGIDVELLPGAADSGSRRDEYETLLDTGETEPDLMLMDVGWTNIFIQRGLIANVEEELESGAVESIRNNYFEALVSSASDQDGALYGVPLFPDFGVMQYRKDYAREAGYTDDDFETWATEPMSWEEWSQVTAEVVDASDAQFGLSTQMQIYEGTACCSFNEVLASWGGNYFGGEENLNGPVGDRPITVDTQEFVDALAMMRTFVNGDDPNALEGYAGSIAPSDITEWTENESFPQMENGNAAMHRNWPYAIESNANEFGVDNYGTMPIPYAVEEGEAAQPGMGGTASALGGWNMTLNPNTENPDAALEVLSTAMEDDFNLGLLDVWGWLPPKPALFESEEAQSLEPIGQYMNTLQVAGENAVPRPVTEVWPTESELIAEEVNNGVSGAKSPQQAASDLQSGLEEIESE